ncbi:hypothetical protein [Bathymodiolus platifrons methanotrophic gill symbiont]|uniref:hypothetical protein n=1 Tax=Bathymodiolus platifrons methanotrophic gill symbiont TaxID=113268 RepID=UPI001124EBAF|nr:hypothetical protein [Bathymodiolus platifrons methanotrophic gill symbiont]
MNLSYITRRRRDFFANPKCARAAGASPICCVGERITATGVLEFREVAWRSSVRPLPVDN